MSATAVPRHRAERGPAAPHRGHYRSGMAPTRCSVTAEGWLPQPSRSISRCLRRQVRYMLLQPMRHRPSAPTARRRRPASPRSRAQAQRREPVGRERRVGCATELKDSSLDHTGRRRARQRALQRVCRACGGPTRAPRLLGRCLGASARMSTRVIEAKWTRERVSDAMRAWDVGKSREIRSTRHPPPHRVPVAWASCRQRSRSCTG
jgi:hypothetical protein